MPELKVTPMAEGGYVVRGTQDTAQAAQALIEWVRREQPEYLASDGGWLVPPVHRAGLFRWNPCNERSCWDGGGHSGHIGYCDEPGKGVWPGVYFADPY